MSVQRTSSNLLFVGVLCAIGGVYLIGRLVLHRPDGRLAERPAELAEPEETSEKQREETVVVATPPASTALQTAWAEDPPALELATSAARWEVSGRLLAPPASPIDSTLTLIALPHPPATLSDPWKPPDWNDLLEGERAEANIASDGHFQIILPAHWERAWIGLSGRFLYFDEPLEVVQEERTRGLPLLLRPRLGAWVRGTVLAEDGTLLEEAFIRRARVSAVPDLGAPHDALAHGGPGTPVNGRLSARPSDEGAFELRGVPPSTNFVIAPVADGLLPGRAALLHAQPGAVLDLDFRLLPGGTLRGRIVDPDGHPLTGVSVSYRGNLELDGFAPLFGSWSVEDGTDESGLFELAGLPARAQLEIGCTLEGWILPDPLVVDLSSPKQGVEVEAVLHRGRALLGRVLWADGSPAPGFKVRLERHAREIAAARTDEHGAFHFAGLDGRSYSLYAHGVETIGPDPVDLGSRNRIGWTRVIDLDPNSDEVLLTLSHGLRLDGSVITAGGEALEAFELTLLSVDIEGATSGFQSTHSGGHGGFQLEGLQPGSWNLTAHAEGYVSSAPCEVRLPRPATSEPLRFELIATGSAAGTVVDPEGHALAGARIRSIVSWRAASGRTATEWKTDAYGHFHVKDLLPGSHRWIASAHGFASSTMVEVLIPAGGVVDDIEIALREGGLLTGVLLNERDEPEVGRFLSVARADSLDTRTGRTDRSGGFAFKELEPGNWRVYVRPEGESGGRSAPLEQPALSAEVVIHDGDESHVVLGGNPAPQIPAKRLRGQVVSDTGQPQAGVLVSLGEEGPLPTCSPYGSRLLQVESDAEGRFEFEALALGTYSLCAFPEARHGGLAPRVARSITLNASEDESTEIVVELTRGGSLGGVVLDLEGLPIPNASIFIRERAGLVLARISELSSDENGRFLYPALVPGRYTIFARTGDASTLESAPLEVSAGVHTQTEIVLTRGTLLSVRLEGTEGTALPARVLVLDELGRRVNGLVGMETFLREIESGFSDLEQRVGPLAPGTYQISAKLEDGRRVERTIELSGAPTERVVLRVE